MVERGAVWVGRNVHLDLFFVGVDEGFAFLLEYADAGPRSVAVLGLGGRVCGVERTEE